MIAYIINGKSFGNCVDYVTRRSLEEKLFDQTSKRQKSAERKYEPAKRLASGLEAHVGEAGARWRSHQDPPQPNGGDDILDHLSKDWDLIGASSDIRLYEGRKAIAEDISRPTKLRKPIESPVGHISLDFHPDDAPTMTDERMTDVAVEYMKQMGLLNTPFIIVRHHDKKHPHCHLVFSRVDYDGKILSQTTNFKRNERVCKALNKKYGLNVGTSKLNTDISKLRGKEKVRYQVTQDISRCFPVASDWSTYLAVLNKLGVTTKEKVSRNGNVNLYYCKNGYEFWSQKLHKNLDRKTLENYFESKRMQQESQRTAQQHCPHATPPQPRKAVNTQPKEIKPIVIPPLPFEFLWGVPKCDEAAYRRGETVYTFARRPGDMYNAHYWIWHDFKTGKPQCSFDPPKSRDIPPAFLQQVVYSCKTSSPQSESTDFRMSHVSLSNSLDDAVCIVHGEPVSGDFKQFLENHPDMDFYDAKRKFKEEQKAKQKVRQGPKLH